MSVRAKFYVTEISYTKSGGSVKLQPVVRGEENKEWSKVTPSGSLQMSILNPEALAFFKGLLDGEGNPEVYVDIRPAD